MTEFERTTVPINKVLRDAVLRKAGIRSWYAQAGFELEQDEYSVQPERKGWRIDENGVKNPYGVLSLDYEYGEGHGEDENPHTLMDLLADTLEADDALEGYSEVGESEDVVLARVTEVAGLTKGEQAATRWVLDGNGLQGEYRDRMSAALGITTTAAKRAWQKARDKLRDKWWYEPEVEPKERLKASLEGAGLTSEGSDQERWKGTHRPPVGPRKPRVEVGLPLRTRIAWGRPL